MDARGPWTSYNLVITQVVITQIINTEINAIRKEKLMKRTITIVLGCLLLPLLTLAEVKVGTEAPNFTGVDSKGVSHSVSEYRGKYVVLEWHNNGCPFVRKHYGSGN